MSYRSLTKRIDSYVWSWRFTEALEHVLVLIWGRSPNTVNSPRNQEQVNEAVGRGVISTRSLQESPLV